MQWKRNIEDSYFKLQCISFTKNLCWFLYTCLVTCRILNTKQDHGTALCIYLLVCVCGWLIRVQCTSTLPQANLSLIPVTAKRVVSFLFFTTCFIYRLLLFFLLFVFLSACSAREHSHRITRTIGQLDFFCWTTVREGVKLSNDFFCCSVVHLTDWFKMYVIHDCIPKGVFWFSLIAFTHIAERNDYKDIWKFFDRNNSY